MLKHGTLKVRMVGCYGTGGGARVAGRQAPLLVRNGPYALASLVMFDRPEGRARLFIEPRKGHLPVAFRGGLALVVEHCVGHSRAVLRRVWPCLSSSVAGGRW